MGPESWRKQTLGEFVTLQRGHDLPDRNRQPGNVPILGSFGITGWHNEAKASGPGVTVGRSGASFGTVSYTTEDYWPLNTALYVVDFHGNDERFAYYFLKNFDFQSYNSGSAQPSLNRNHVHPVPISVPPLPEQRAIAHVLGTLDDKIELNRRMNETLEGMARALFKSWFVDFDPVRAKMAGRPTGIPPELDALFPDALVESALGEIPVGWEVASVAGIARVFSGKRPGERFSEAKPDAGIPLWGGNGPMAYVSEPLVDRPVLLTGRVGTLGSVFRVTIPFWPSDNTLVLEANSDFTFEYLYHQLRQIDYSALNRGSTQPLLTQRDLKACAFVLPPKPLLEAFHAVTKHVYERVDACIAESLTLASIRDSLLPKLISGEIRATALA